MFRKKPPEPAPEPDDSAWRGLSSSRVRALCAEVERQEALAKLAEENPEPIEPQPAQSAATTPPPAPKQPSRFMSAFKALLRGKATPADPPKPQRTTKATFFTAGM